MDHDQFFKHLMQLFLQEFFDLFFPQWLDQDIFPDLPRGEKRVVKERFSFAVRMESWQSSTMK